ncbi:MAG TPA: AI-2E family transporter [Candidatus Paceibacterota bacterium]|nr:AI-2E family transporter [Candidatus Paceibacterota bacterium]
MIRWAERHQLLALGAVAGGLFFLWILRDIWAILFVGFIIAAALRPLIDILDRFLPRAAAILATYLALLALIFGMIVPAAIPFIGQLGQLGSRLQQTMQHLAGPGTPLASLGLSLDTVTGYLQQNFLDLTTTTITAIASVVSAIIISIYLLYDWHERQERLAGGERPRQMLAEGIAASERALGNWVRGELVLGAAVGVLSLIALIILGIPFAPVLAMLAAILELIPYAGPILAAIPAVILAASDSTTAALIVGLAYLIIQQIENHVLVPLVMKHAIELHPVTIIVVLFIGFELMGIAGAFLAVPAALLIQAAYRTLARHGAL